MCFNTKLKEENNCNEIDHSLGLETQNQQKHQNVKSLEIHESERIRLLTESGSCSR